MGIRNPHADFMQMLEHLWRRLEHPRNIADQAAKDGLEKAYLSMTASFLLQCVVSIVLTILLVLVFIHYYTRNS